MNSKIVETLELMCDKDNPQDKKILLLAELVESKYDELGKNQKDLKDSLSETNKKLDDLTTLLKQYQNDIKTCPVNVNRKGYDKLSFFMTHPKITLITLLGIVALLAGFFGSQFTKLLNLL